MHVKPHLEWDGGRGGTGFLRKNIKSLKDIDMCQSIFNEYFHFHWKPLSFRHSSKFCPVSSIYINRITKVNNMLPPEVKNKIIEDLIIVRIESWIGFPSVSSSYTHSKINLFLLQFRELLLLLVLFSLICSDIVVIGPHKYLNRTYA